MFRFITCLLLGGVLTTSWAQFVNPRTGAPRPAPQKTTTTQPTTTRPTPARTPARRSATGRSTTRPPRQRSAGQVATQPAAAASDADHVQIFLTNGTTVSCMWVETSPTEIIYRDLAGTVWRVPRSQVRQIVVAARPPGSASAAVTQEPKNTTTTAASTTPMAAVTATTKPAPATAATPVSNTTSVAGIPAKTSARQRRADRRKADSVSKAGRPGRAEKPKPEKANKAVAESKPKRERRKSAAPSERSRAASAGNAFGGGDKFLEFSLGLNGSRSKTSGASLPADQTVSALTISPVVRYGVFTSDNVAWGGGIQATFGNETPTAAGERKSTTYSPFAFVRRYLLLNESIALYGEGMLGVDYQTDKLTRDTLVLREQKTLTPMIRLSGGATVRLGEAWWLNGQATLVGVTYNRRTFGPDTQAQANLELIGRNTRSLFTLSLVRFF